MKLLKSIITRFSANPKQLLGLDLCGALLSTIVMGLIFWKLYVYFGISKSTFKVLFLVALLILTCSSFCYFSIKDKTNKPYKPYLWVLIFINSSYCFITLSILIGFYSKLTVIGFAYFLIEILVIISLVLIEKKVCNRL